ncbi:MAG: hypothetical protein QOJ80_830 [Mycobacterium sp.]|jgi:hypothetical protein|nr:hypothetical protein [Mycobacterium sp.]
MPRLRATSAPSAVVALAVTVAVGVTVTIPATTKRVSVPTVLVDSTTFLPAAPIKTAPPNSPPEPADASPARLFTGDYSTGDFTQWPGVQTAAYNGPGTDYVPDYSASVVPDPVKGNVARFELRSGDRPEFGGGERAEVQSTPEATGGFEGRTVWYAFSTKFDPSFPLNHADLGWGLTNQWHSDADGSPPVGWYVDQRNGYWSLVVHKQDKPGDYTQTFSIVDVPIDPGAWHDVKMQIRWSASDREGWIRLWLNGVRQKFADGADTFEVRTMVPGTTNVYYKEGIYRQPEAQTDVVFHTGFRSATAEAGL